MTLDIEIRFPSSVWKQIMKWYNLAFQGKHPTKEDEKYYHMIEVLYESERENEKDEAESD